MKEPTRFIGPAGIHIAPHPHPQCPNKPPSKLIIIIIIINSQIKYPLDSSHTSLFSFLLFSSLFFSSHIHTSLKFFLFFNPSSKMWKSLQNVICKYMDNFFVSRNIFYKNFKFHFVNIEVIVWIILCYKPKMSCCIIELKIMVIVLVY